MKINRILLFSVMVSLPGLALAEGAENFRYSGNSQARQICKAVVQDDVKVLRRTLRSYQTSLVSHYSKETSGREVARDFTCNGMDLQVFAERVGARQVVGFIAGDAGTDKTQLAAAGE